MRRFSFWLFVIGAAALCAYLLDSIFLSSSLLKEGPARPLSRAPGNPIFSSLKMPETKTLPSHSYTNEEIYRNLQKQTLNMGIQEIIPGNSKEESQDSGDFPLSPGLFQNQKDNGVYIKGKTPTSLKDAKSGDGQ
jgi:hypothetical protein